MQALIRHKGSNPNTRNDTQEVRLATLVAERAAPPSSHPFPLRAPLNSLTMSNMEDENLNVDDQEMEHSTDGGGDSGSRPPEDASSGETRERRAMNELLDQYVVPGFSGTAVGTAAELRALMRRSKPGKTLRRLMRNVLRAGAAAGPEDQIRMLNGQIRCLESKVQIAECAFTSKSLQLKEVEADRAQLQNQLEATAEEAAHLHEQLGEKDRVIEEQAGEITGLQSSVANLHQEVQELKGKEALFDRKSLASALSKPPQFDGKGILLAQGGQQVEEWAVQVERYCTSLHFSDSDTVAVAASLLRGDAARAWTAEEAVLQGNNQPLTLVALKQCLLKRFTPAATVHQARMRLDGLQLSKGKGGLARFVADFDAVCTLIPDLSEAEKRHRFVTGISALNPDLARAICTDPVNSELFTDYVRMRRSALNFASVSAEFASKTQANLVELGAGLSSLPSSKRHKGNAWVASGGSAGAGSSKGGSGGAGSGGAGSSKGGSSGAGSSKAAAAAGNGGKQNDPVFAFCIAHGLCRNCFGKGHRQHECKSPRKKGVPEGYDGPLPGAGR